MWLVFNKQLSLKSLVFARLFLWELVDLLGFLLSFLLCCTLKLLFAVPLGFSLLSSTEFSSLSRADFACGLLSKKEGAKSACPEICKDCPCIVCFMFVRPYSWDFSRDRFVVCQIFAWFWPGKRIWLWEGELVCILERMSLMWLPLKLHFKVVISSDTTVGYNVLLISVLVVTLLKMII